jgi:hypothetical protein
VIYWAIGGGSRCLATGGLQEDLGVSDETAGGFNASLQLKEEDDSRAHGHNDPESRNIDRPVLLADA